MSEFYDSLEDEGDDDEKSSFGYLNRKNQDFTESNKKNEDYRKFYATKENFKEKDKNTFLKVQCNKTAESNVFKDSNFLPKINKNGVNGDKSGLLSTVIDPEILSKQGLQLNNDGGIIKSPKSNTDELPFVTREYRNLQFQKKKTYDIKKKGRTKVNKTNVFTFSENPENGISMCEIISARKKKGSSEEILVSENSSSFFRDEASKIDKKFDNMTDSMKATLMEKLKERKEKKSSLKKKREELEKCSLDSLEADQPPDPEQSLRRSQTKCLLPCIPVKKNLAKADVLQKRSWTQCHFSKPQEEKKIKSYKAKVFRHQSDVLIKTAKPNLSYVELRQKENGFNPLNLRLGNKKTPSQTSRSNFGDSVAERLSEVSGRVSASQENFNDEDEDLFYRKLMAKEKSRLLGVYYEAKSDVSRHSQKVSISKESDLGKTQNELQSSETINTKVKRLLKSASIDLPAVRDCPMKKISHYCSANPSPCMSKIELARKAKVYGYLANARNIFKMKTQSEGKLTDSKKENSSRNVTKENSNLATVLNNKTKAGKKSLSLANNEPGTFLRTSTSLCKTEKYQIV